MFHARSFRAVLVLLAAAGAATAARGQGGTLPPGFEDVPIVTGLNQPTAIAFAPDDRLFICEKGGRVQVFKQGQLLATPFLTLAVSSNSERGLLGIAFDPAFASTQHVYLYYTLVHPATGTPKNRVSRFTASGDVVVPGSELVLVDQIPSDAGNHNAGCVRFGLDGKLYIPTGDGGANANNSQNLGNLAGKILRIEPAGGIPQDHPFVNTPGARGEIFCYGLRNPFRFQFRPGTNTMYIADVGQDTWEEVNVGQAGGNYGWPQTEGPTSAAGVIPPLYAYHHNGSGASITGGGFVTSSNYPVEYRGTYFFGDYVDSVAGRLVVSPQDTLQQAVSFGPCAGPVDFAQGPDGDLYYVSISTGSVRKFRFTGPQNRPPVARASANPLAGPVPLNVAFSSAGSSDPDGDALTYLWTFGDGTTSSAANPSHTYAQAGTYTATLQVSDGRGGVTQADPLTIRAGNRAPTATITSPADEALYNAGDMVFFAGTATDPDEGPLDGSRMRWVITFFHADHTHPFEQFDAVSGGSFTIPTTGEASADTWYQLELSATDADGAQGTACVQIRPRKVELTFKTSPKRLIITFNGQPFRTPVKFLSVVNFQHALGAQDQKQGGRRWYWKSWSDGGARDHTINAPGVPRTYTATFGRRP